jgi:hypothetical protein
VSVGAKRIAFPLESPLADRAEIEADIRSRTVLTADGQSLVERMPEEPKVVKLH